MSLLQCEFTIKCHYRFTRRKSDKGNEIHVNPFMFINSSSGMNYVPFMYTVITRNINFIQNDEKLILFSFRTNNIFILIFYIYLILLIVWEIL